MSATTALSTEPFLRLELIASRFRRSTPFIGTCEIITGSASVLSVEPTHLSVRHNTYSATPSAFQRILAILHAVLVFSFVCCQALLTDEKLLESLETPNRYFELVSLGPTSEAIQVTLRMECLGSMLCLLCIVAWLLDRPAASFSIIRARTRRAWNPPRVNPGCTAAAHEARRASSRLDFCAIQISHFLNVNLSAASQLLPGILLVDFAFPERFQVSRSIDISNLYPSTSQPCDLS